MPALLFGKARQQLLDQIRLAIAYIDPLRQAADEGRGIHLLRAHGGKEVLVLIEQGNTARDVAHHQVVFQLLEKLARDAGILFHIEAGCGHGACDNSTSGPTRPNRTTVFATRTTRASNGGGRKKRSFFCAAILPIVTEASS